MLGLLLILLLGSLLALVGAGMLLPGLYLLFGKRQHIISRLMGVIIAVPGAAFVCAAADGTYQFIFGAN